MSKTIVEKLNLQKYEKVAVLDCPQGGDILAGLEHHDTALQNSSYDLIFAFVLETQALQELVQKVIENQHLDENGYMYVAYPKKGNKVYSTYIHRDRLFDALGADAEGFIGNSHLKFARMVGLNDVFTVVGFKQDIKSKNKVSSKPSQCVDDYIELVPSIENDLQQTPQLLDFYRSLTPGYRKDWARYVYSAKQEATKEKRRDEMKMILGAGYKSRDLYIRDK